MSTAPNYDLLDLLEDARYDDALLIIDAALREDPDSAPLRSLRALVLLDKGDREDAFRHADLARTLDPENGFVQYAYGTVALRQGEIRACIDAARVAQALAPDDAEYLLLEARGWAQLNQWRRVGELADQALALKPDDEQAATLRMIAMRVQTTGRLPEEAWSDFATRFPLNPLARTGRAWTHLERGRFGAARGEFEQALALDPSLEWARQGLVLSLKAGNPAYALLLRYFLWMEQLPQRTRTLLIVGGYFGYRGVSSLARSNPELAPFLVPVIVLYVGFVLLTWLADPLLNLLLMARPEGRRLLNGDQQQGAVAVGVCIAASLALAISAWALNLDNVYVPAVGLGLSSIGVAAVYRAEKGSGRRRWMQIVMIAVAAAALGSAALPGLLAIPIIAVAVLTWVTALSREPR